MSSLGTTMSTALRALQANQFGLAVASNNISNSGTPGYTRQRALLRPAPSTGGEMAVGTGVEVVGAESIRDHFIEERLQQESSRQSENDSMHQSLSDVEMLFNDSNSMGMLPALTSFFNSFHSLSTDPTSPQLRQQLISNASSLVDAFHGRYGELKNMQSTINRSIGEDVTKVNELTSQISSLTTEITQQEVTSPANELRDQREILVRQLSEIVEVKQLESPGNYQLSIGENRALVFDGTSVPLTADPSSAGYLEVHYGQEDITSEVTGGRLSARVNLRDQYIPKYLDALNQLAYEIGDQVNQLHESAHDLDGDTGVSFFQPMDDAQDAAYNLSLSSEVNSSYRNVAVSASSSGLDNEVALSIGNLLHSSVFSGGSVTDQYRSLVYSIGSDTANADLATKQHEALATQLENRRQSLSGVSVDEETMKILQFQRAFQASARVVQVVDELLQVTLTLGQS